jgi:anaerobic magnesium-protoporphyrin IX monomethyl ester cyclase
MRVLFAVPRSFNPKQMYREYPLGAGYLGTVLKHHDHEVRIFDQNAEGLDDNALVKLIAEFQPAVVGFSVITPNYPVARRQLQLLKERYPEIPAIAGGIHTSLFPEDVLRDGADAVVLGEGELVIVELVSRLVHNEDLSHLPGVVYRGASGELIRTAGWSQIAKLDELPFVDRTLFNLSRYTHHSMLASRGCPHRCAFCCNYTGTVRNDGVAIRWHEKVLDEMQYLRDAFGAREIFFADDIFLLRKQDIRQFCESCVRRDLGIRWIGQMRADRVDDAIAAGMAQAGCQRIYFGVESGSERILRDAKKGMTKDQICRGITAAKNAGMRVKTGWIYGLPGTLEDQYESIDFMLQMRPHEISIHQLIPFPGTVYYTEPARFGIRIANPKAFESFCYGGLEGDIRFDYLSHGQLVQLLEDTAQALETAGYVNSDKDRGSEYVYTTPLSRNSMNVFRSSARALAC